MNYMAHFKCIALIYTPILFSHQNFTADKLTLTSESRYISAIHYKAMVYTFHNIQYKYYMHTVKCSCW